MRSIRCYLLDRHIIGSDEKGYMRCERCVESLFWSRKRLQLPLRLREWLRWGCRMKAGIYR